MGPNQTKSFLAYKETINEIKGHLLNVKRYLQTMYLAKA